MTDTDRLARIARNFRSASPTPAAGTGAEDECDVCFLLDSLNAAEARAQALEAALKDAVEHCARIVETSITATEMDIAMNKYGGDFPAWKMALVVNLICGKIIAEKAAAIRAHVFNTRAP